MHDPWDLHDFLVMGAAMQDTAVLKKLLAMVRGDDQKGVVIYLIVFEELHKLFDAVIHLADAGVI